MAYMWFIYDNIWIIYRYLYSLYVVYIWWYMDHLWICFVIYPPLWKIWVSQWGWWNSQLNGNMKNVPTIQLSGECIVCFSILQPSVKFVMSGVKSFCVSSRCSIISRSCATCLQDHGQWDWGSWPNFDTLQEIWKKLHFQVSMYMYVSHISCHMPSYWNLWHL